VQNSGGILLRFAKVVNFLLPTDEKRPTDLEKNFSCLIPHGLNPVAAGFNPWEN